MEGLLENQSGWSKRPGQRLVYIIERLQEALGDIAGSGDSATIFMRLGNAGEAEAAAKQIGREHKFILSQLTRGFSDAVTKGFTRTEGGGVSTTQTTGSSTGPGLASSHNRSVAEGAQRNWGVTESWGQTRTTSGGESESRVYEYAVEPTVLQNLPHTAFVLVDSGSAGRRVVIGDANPGIAALDRVASKPRKPTTSQLATSSPHQAAQSRPQRSTVSLVRIDDPERMFGDIAEGLRDIGYGARYDRDERRPRLGGWEVYRLDGVLMDVDEVKFVTEHFPY